MGAKCWEAGRVYIWAVGQGVGENFHRNVLAPKKAREPTRPVIGTQGSAPKGRPCQRLVAYHEAGPQMLADGHRQRGMGKGNAWALPKHFALRGCHLPRRHSFGVGRCGFRFKKTNTPMLYCKNCKNAL